MGEGPAFGEGGGTASPRRGDVVKGVRGKILLAEGEAPRRILMTTDAVGGIWCYALELARGLGGYGVEVILAVMGPPPSLDQLREVRGIRNVTLYRKEFPLEWMENPWEGVAQAGGWLLELADALHPDLAHLNGYVHAALPWPCPRLVVGHFCLLSRWEAVHTGAPAEKLERYREKVAAGLAAADLVVAPSRTMLAMLERLYPPLERSLVIHNGRSRRRFKPGCKEHFIFCVGGGADEEKNVTSVAAGARLLPWPVFWAGAQGNPDEGVVPPDLTNRLGLLAPKRLASWFARASIYAHPARYEPFGLTVLEAAMSRCALVLGDIPSLHELWDGAAVFVPPGDSEALLAELRALCENRERREQASRKAFARSLDFSGAKMASQYLEAYRLLGRTPGGTPPLPGSNRVSPGPSAHLPSNAQALLPT